MQAKPERERRGGIGNRESGRDNKLATVAKKSASPGRITSWQMSAEPKLRPCTVSCFSKSLYQVKHFIESFFWENGKGLLFPLFRVTLLPELFRKNVFARERMQHLLEGHPSYLSPSIRPPRFFLLPMINFPDVV